MTGTIVKITPSFYGIVTFYLDNGHNWCGDSGTYNIGDKVKLVPFMGAVRVERVQA